MIFILNIRKWLLKYDGRFFKMELADKSAPSQLPDTKIDE